ncbi:MAG: AMP-binding protein [Christensenellales bacterium]|jgi:D-alanine--poly(phosphoribitol) ligase subunit 1|nr:amino acid adenylation domain-containing protein [Clostridiales bacterium]
MVDNVLKYLENAVNKWPNRVAFSDEKTSITFTTLYDTVRGIGSAVAECTRPRQPVAVLMNDRNVQCVAGLLGVLYAGCPYAPLDIAMPTERLQIILDQLKPAAILCDESTYASVMRANITCPVLTAEAAACHQIDENHLAAIRSQTSIYDILSILYTSGSTGIPKGVAQSQFSYIMYTEATVEKYSFTQETIFGNQSPFFYANSIIDIYPPLLLGATVYILPAQCLSFPKVLVEHLCKHRITELTMTPSSYIKAAQAGVLKEGCLPDLKYIILSGEAAHWQTLQKWMAAAPNAGVWNFYGSTEVFSVAVWCIDQEFSDDEVIPVGLPYKEVEILIVDENGEQLPRGERGEMLIANPWLCSGYYLDTERTQEAFVIDPLDRGYYTRYYRTGDIGCISEEGVLTVLGRKDSQIKRGGYRMEIGEVEVALRKIPGWKNGCVLYDQEQEKLCCFWEGSLTQKEIQSALRKQLPRYALPDTFIHVEALPYTATMKLNREMLRKMI